MYLHFKVIWCRFLWSQVLQGEKRILNTINEYTMSILGNVYSLTVSLCLTRPSAFPSPLCSKTRVHYPRHISYLGNFGHSFEFPVYVRIFVPIH